jgi:hypothetical protein
VDALDARQARWDDPLLASGYRDHAAKGSMLHRDAREELGRARPRAQRAHAEMIRDRALERGVVELLLFDGDL